MSNLWVVVRRKTESAHQNLPILYAGRMNGHLIITPCVDDAASFTKLEQAQHMAATQASVQYQAWQFDVQLLGGAKAVKCLSCSKSLRTHFPARERICQECVTKEERKDYWNNRNEDARRDESEA